MMNPKISKELQRIPLAYFNDTVDRVFLEYIDIQKDAETLKSRKDNINEENQKMFMSKKMALEKAIEKRNRNAQEKLVILQGFMSVTTQMCEERLKEIFYALKTHPEQIEDAAELKSLEDEQNGIFDYMAKVEEIRDSINEEPNADDTQGDEPEA